MGEKASMWNLWHGCHKLSEGCRHCYVYRTDGKYGKDSSVVTKTEKFDLPLLRKKNGTYKICLLYTSLYLRKRKSCAWKKWYGKKKLPPSEWDDD